MNIIQILKLLGAKLVQRQLAREIKKHTSKDGYKVLATAFSECVDGCAKQDADAVAQGITDALFSIR